MRQGRHKAALCLLFCCCLHQPLAALAHQQIVNVRIIDGAGQQIERGWIEFQGERITGLGSGAPPRLTERHIDGSGLTLMPGFIDTHRHLFSYTNIRSDRALRRYVKRKLPGILQGLLQAGFTTVLSPGDYTPEIFDVREQLLDGRLSGPRLLATGRMLHAPNDHPASTLCRGNSYCRRKLSGVVTDDASARARVRELVNEGADMIKAVHDRELATHTVIDDSLIIAMADEARTLDVPFSLHTRVSADFVRLANRGIRRMVHTPLIGAIRESDSAQNLTRLGLAVQSTLSWASPEIASARRQADSAGNRARLQQGLENVRYLLNQQIPIAFGTDNPPPLGDVSFMPEVRALSQVLSNAEIIRAMTLHAAIFLHREQEIGSIAPGMIADLVLLEGNPLTDLSALEQVRQVIHKGRLAITGG